MWDDHARRLPRPVAVSVGTSVPGLVMRDGHSFETMLRGAPSHLRCRCLHRCGLLAFRRGVRRSNGLVLLYDLFWKSVLGESSGSRFACDMQ